MIHFKPGSHVYNIIDLLSVIGEYPLCSLEILGSRQTYENAIRRMLIPQKILDGKEELNCKLLTVSGLNGRRRIRLTKEALPILKWLGAENYYYENYMRSHRSGNSEHTVRSTRFAESVAMFQAAGYEFRPHKLPRLQAENCRHIIGSAPVFYPAKLIKTFDGDDVKKTGFTRMTGALLADKRAYVVYNTRDELMKGFEYGGEIKAKLNVSGVAAFNADGDSSYDCPAIIFGKSNEIALTMLKTYNEFWDKYKRVRNRITTYDIVHFFTLDSNGVKQLRLMKYSDWDKRILELLFDKEALSQCHNYFAYNSYEDGIYWLSFLDGDIMRLRRFGLIAKDNPQKHAVICFTHQVDLVRSYLGEDVAIYVADYDKIAEALSD